MILHSSQGAGHGLHCLLVEDDEIDAQLVTRTLCQVDGVRSHLRRAASLGEAVDRLEEGDADIVLLDLSLPDSEGLHTVERILEAAPNAAIVVLTGIADREMAVAAVRAGAQDYLHKDRVNAEVLARTLTYAVERRRSVEHVRRLNAELEGRVAQRTRELEEATARLGEANRDLDAFAHTATHDLRAPLRAIHGFASMLEEDYEAVLDDDGRHILGRIKSAITRMNRLLDSLKTLAGASSASFEPRPCDLSAMARGIVAELASAAPERVVDVEIEPELTVTGDAGLLDLLLRNLLSNAWKYTRKRGTARIRLRAEPDAGGRRVFCVSDNGVGFDVSNGADPFAPFQRLHGEREFEGDGLGLATARRIVDRHGGRIWAESAPGEGARVYFYISNGSGGNATTFQ